MPSAKSTFVDQLPAGAPSSAVELAARMQMQLETVAAEVGLLVDGDGANLPRPSGPSSRRALVSFVIPAHDEQATIVELCRRIVAATPEQYDIELLLIDDGSLDQTWNEIAELSSADALESRTAIRGIRMRHNAGKAAALTAGFRTARGDLVFTMDADLQDDPQEIPRFLEAIRNGADVVTGWKRKRYDPWHKVWCSRVFNWMLSKLTRVHLHDHNCGFKCYRGDVVKRLEPHGELHRMMPCLAATHGFRTTEIEVSHSPRRYGRSKYGFERIARGFSDMVTMAFLMRFRQRPAHFFNWVALLYGLTALSLAIGSSAVGLATTKGTAVFLTSLVLLGLAGVTFAAGLVAEMLIRDGRLSRRELPIAETISSRQSRQLAIAAPTTGTD